MVEKNQESIQHQKGEKFCPNQFEDRLIPPEKHLFEAGKDAQTWGFAVVIGVNAVEILLNLQMMNPYSRIELVDTKGNTKKVFETHLWVVWEE